MTANSPFPEPPMPPVSSQPDEGFLPLLPNPNSLQELEVQELEATADQKVLMDLLNDSTDGNDRRTSKERVSVRPAGSGTSHAVEFDASDDISDERMQQAALMGDVEQVRQLLEQGTSVNAPMQCDNLDGDKFATLLHVLSSRPDQANCKEMVGEVLKAKANVNGRSSLGSTPLMRACLAKNVATAELLLSYGASPKPRDDLGRDAASCCVSLPDEREEMPAEAEEMSAEILVMLADKSADLDQVTVDHAPLLEAILCQNYAAIVALTELGATARFLHQAVETAPQRIIEHLLKADANPFEEDTKGQTVLDVAFRRGDEDIISMLRNHIGDLERNNQVMTGRGSLNRSPSGGPTSTFRPVNSAAGTSSGRTSVFSCDTEAPDGGLGLSSTAMKGLEVKNESEGSSRRLSLRRISNTLGNHPHLFQKRKMMLVDLNSPLAIWVRAKCKRAQESCLKINNNKWFQAIMFTALFTVLYLPDLWVLGDMDHNGGLDVILILVLILFIIEIFVQTVGLPSVYINSFFFWMDLVGACSVPLDHSAVSDNLPQNFDNAVVMRAARTARLGARAGRFTKLVKLLRFLPGVNYQALGASGSSAKNMSNQLMQSLSTRVSCLIIVMVMVLPLFDLATYPENDFSMKTWMNALDYTMERTPSDIDRKILDFQRFYTNKDYYPFKVTLQQPNGTMLNTRLRALAPRRSKNEVVITADSGTTSAVFNFGIKNRVDALCNMLLITTIIILMMGFSLLLSNSVSAIVLVPLENLLSGVKKMASKIFKSVTSITKKVGEKEETKKNQEELFGNETELLEKVIDKLAALNSITMKASPMDAETLEQLGENERAVMQGFHGTQHAPDQVQAITADAVKKKKDKFATSGSDNISDSGLSTSSDDEVAPTAANAETLVFTLEKNLEEAELSWDEVDNVSFNSLDVDDKQRQLVCLTFLIFHLGLQYSGEKHTILTSFIKAAAAGYNPNEVAPYHNWAHAVDVTHSVFRFLNCCATERFLSNLERYALVVSGLCHDIGHPGFNNPYLVETSHELAIRYNDRSPLENMHCAKLFELVNASKTAVFSQFSKSEFREIRQVCIEAILHTDNTLHFAMVKELQMLYEMNSDIFDMSIGLYQQSKVDFPPKEIIDIFNEPEKKKLMRNLSLHFSDISNPTKPFEICKAWAWAIVDEFFMQGDKEKELGITVQPLNDRDKVNRPYSQVGFIEFFVAPFAFATVRLLPPLLPSTDQLIHNLTRWCDEWVQTTTPEPNAEEQTKLKDRVTKLEAKYSFREGYGGT